MKKQLLPLLALFVLSCGVMAVPVAAPLPQPATVPVLPTATALPDVPAVTSTPFPTPTLAPFEEYTIDYLRKRTYGGGKIDILQKLTETDLITSYAIRYPSDGLHIYGAMSVPKGEGPFPVIIAIHGYAFYDTYDPFNPLQASADLFAANQYIVINPGLRNQPPSDHGDNTLRVGMTTDIMNLIALIKAREQMPVELVTSDPNQIGILGISMGGEIGLRVITISPDVKAAVFYAPLSGNTDRNSRQLYERLQDEEFRKDFDVPLEMLDRISPVYHYNLIKAAVQIHQGTEDKTAPVSWASETCDFLRSAGVSVECIYYQGAGHIFTGDLLEQVRQKALEFFGLHLSP